MKKFTPPWRDPIEDPPDEYTDVLVTNEMGRVFSVRYSKGKWSTYTPIRCWMPMPSAGQEIKDETAQKPAETPAQPKTPAKKTAVKRKTKV